ncbi:prolipoprotein diacylglyceryl transferase [Thermocrinis minervae]|uniref:Phosphatidylglycerol--prolipoprotein diacylglyceryl transferase n=1 Tax=Thermocrinis minervae TaxID=381751 RepID=A0A1M6SWV9_9AQUI|nr:prolipoprotein diacylglyceryl transferase [Thermocrinis minervae]SHK49147.1 Prolipoprotein diacylglyceryl transferase [Thermocrinis minervae]
MFPVLFEFFGIKVYTYGVLIALGALLAYTLSIKLSKREGLNTAHVENTFFIALMLGVVGGRLAYVIEHPEQVKGIVDIISIWNGGMDFFGGLFGGVLGALFGVWFYKLPVWKIADISSISLSLAHAIGRLGCTSAGCCYGKPFPGEAVASPGIHFSDKFPFFYVVFPEGAVAPPYMPLYPTQLMEFIGLMLIFLMLLFFYRRKPFDGFVFSIYMFLYGLLRFFLEFYRGVTPPIEAIGLTWNQVVSILMVISSFLLFFTLRKSKREIRA